MKCLKIMQCKFSLVLVGYCLRDGAIFCNIFVAQLNEQTNRLTDINERLRIYNQKLQDRLATTIEDKVQAESTLASVRIVNDDESIEDKKMIPEDDKKESVSREEGVRIEKKEQKDEGQNTEKGKDLNGFKTQKSAEGDSKINANSMEKEVKNTKETENSKNGKTGEPAGKEQPVKKDPNRPRYTLAEMQQVLEERNRYKERVSVLEDVLEAYAPG